ncbi:MAG: hypothetical protein ACYCXT_13355 [Acidiferrobacteraceae bacterium]
MNGKANEPEELDLEPHYIAEDKAGRSFSNTALPPVAERSLIVEP